MSGNFQCVNLWLPDVNTTTTTTTTTTNNNNNNNNNNDCNKNNKGHYATCRNAAGSSPG
jgi:hypothetical protein